MRTATHDAEPLPVSHYWGLIKGIDRSQKIELATMIMESIRDEEAADRVQKEQEEQLKPYTMEEINAMLDEAEADFAAGKGIPHEEVMHRSREKLARMRQELETVEAV